MPVRFFHTSDLQLGMTRWYTGNWVRSCLAQICSADRRYKLDLLAMKICDLLASTLDELMTIKGVGRVAATKLLESGYRDTGASPGACESTLVEIRLARKQAASVGQFLRWQAR